MQSEHFKFPVPTLDDEADIEVIANAMNIIDTEIYKAQNIGKYGGNVVYTINIDKRGSGNNVLWVDIDGITSYDDLDGKIIAIYTGIYCCQWYTPQTVYINVNGLGARAIRRPLPTNGSADYDSGRIYYTDKYVKGEISRYQTLLISFSGSSATLLNPASPMRATQKISDEATDGISYVTPKLLAEYMTTVKNALQCDISDLMTTINKLAEIIDVMRIECTEFTCNSNSVSAKVTLYYGMRQKRVTISSSEGTEYNYLILSESVDVDLRESCNDYRLYTQEQYDRETYDNPSLDFYEVVKIDGVDTYYSKSHKLVE